MPPECPTTVFDTIEVDALRKRGALDARPDGITLAALVELACTCTCLREHRRAGDAWFAGLPAWDQTIGWLIAGRRPVPAETYASPVIEVWGIDGADDLDTEWLLYLDRFRRSLTVRGFSAALSAALSKALGEMADNIVQHSGARGMAAFQVRERWAAWTIADLGCGVLKSLRTNPRWSTLASSQAALDAVWRKRATRRTDMTHGNGFSQVELSLASLNGHLRFRSGDAALKLDGTRGGPSRASIRINPALPGTQVSATCALDAAPKRIPATD